MSNVLRQRALNFLNQMEVIESNGGEEAYALVENNEENRYLLTEAGIPLETALKYGDEETFCIIALACSEGYATAYENGKLIYEEEVDISNWIKRCIDGPAGLLAFEKYEWATRKESDEIVAATWIIRCLANPKCKGSEEVLQAIIERRKEVLNA